MLRRIRDFLRLFLDIDREYRLRRLLNRFLPHKRPSEPVHIVHACVWKTASQWFRVVLSDPRVYRHDGRMPFIWTELTKFENRRKELRRSKAGLLLACFASIGDIRAVTGPDRFKAFFVIRDPRDLLISWYFSTRYTHSETEGVLRHRAALEGMDDEEGLLYMMKPFMDEFLPVIESWLEAANGNSDITIVRFEQLTKGGVPVWRELLDTLGMNVPDDTIEDLLETYHISKISAPASTKESSHSQSKYAFSGKDMTRRYLTGRVLEQYNALMPDLAERLGYGPEPASFAKTKAAS